ncbi:aldo/keto reductase [Paenibacillus sacheonensis]|uniref:Aldo/keto reductase n=1 Tax=Paenibacillus sacheonensis TaxID=742054 RepID=A0A7X4YT14_9BACL|nr:aldo/keto reductase [Paenibacillus sacheonensis]MBM7567687.1 aryl-alcohol dehydrogenase-like predicted oxidoreductase [Paenibacillus sacheonensis]NBC72037.1 aldo/keto reductase [Paenibacillus sacheonensis]
MDALHIQGVDKPISRLIMGTGDLRKLEENERLMLRAYVDAGGNAFDTAHQYRGREKLLGEWLAEEKLRDKVVILTKGAHHDDGSPGPRVNPQAIRQDLTESLERLGTDHVEIFALHRDDETVAVGPIIEELNANLEAGRLRAFGASNWTHARIQEANEYAASHGLTGFAFSSTNLSLAKPQEARWPGVVSADEATIAWHAANGMPLLSWSAQAGGFFSGHFTPENRADEEMVRVYYSEGNWERYRRAVKMAGEKGVTPIQLALSYVLHQPFATGAIIGPRNPGELLSSVEAMNLHLTLEEVEWLDLKREAIAQ